MNNYKLYNMLNYAKLGLTLIIVVLASIFAFSALGTAQEYIKSNAIQGCLESSYIKTQGDKSEKQEPSFYVYTLCIKDKGLTTTYNN